MASNERIRTTGITSTSDGLKEGITVSIFCRMGSNMRRSIKGGNIEPGLVTKSSIIATRWAALGSVR